MTYKPNKKRLYKSMQLRSDLIRVVYHDLEEPYIVKYKHIEPYIYEEMDGKLRVVRDSMATDQGAFLYCELEDFMETIRKNLVKWRKIKQGD